MAAYHYAIPGYAPYDYPTSTSTSPSPDEYDYYVPQPRYTNPVASPAGRPSRSRGHVRTASYNPTPRVAQWHSSTGYPASAYYNSVPAYSSPSAVKFEYVSARDSHKPRARRFSDRADGYGSSPSPSGGNAKRYASMRSPTQRIFVDVADEAYDPPVVEPLYTYIEPRTGPAKRSASYNTKAKRASQADSPFLFTQTTSYESADTPVRSRARRSSAAAATTRPKTSSSPKQTKQPKAAPVATLSDAAKYSIPEGFSLKNWDPSERPVLLLGSVFDANSLGKWIYDWTVYHHNPGSPLAEVAGELWLLLIKFAGKMKRAEECRPRIRGRENRDIVKEFQTSGDRIWSKTNGLLKLCEEFMWRVAKKNGARGKVQMGEKSGIEFVKTIFGRERELERTEKLMASIRLWNMRFDANCEEILRRPSAL